MSEPARHLRSVDMDTGEVVGDGCPDCKALEMELRTKRAQITKLKNENARLMGMEPEAETIIDVLEFWRRLCMEGASIIPGSERWTKVRDRLREKDVRTKEQAHSPLKLKAAVTGALLSDFHVTNGYLDATTIFRDSKTVEDHVARCVSFKQRKGISALTLIDELGGGALDWLADRCSCGGLMLEHLSAGPGALPCPQRDCKGFDFLNAKVERHLAEAS